MTNSATQTTRVDDELMNARQAAEYVGEEYELSSSHGDGYYPSRLTLQRWAREGHIKHMLTDDGKIRFTQAQLDECFAWAKPDQATLDEFYRSIRSASVLVMTTHRLPDEELRQDFAARGRMHALVLNDGAYVRVWIHPQDDREHEIAQQFTRAHRGPWDISCANLTTRVRAPRNLCAAMGWTLTADEEAMVDLLATIC